MAARSLRESASVLRALRLQASDHLLAVLDALVSDRKGGLQCAKAGEVGGSNAGSPDADGWQHIASDFRLLVKSQAVRIATAAALLLAHLQLGQRPGVDLCDALVGLALAQVHAGRHVMCCSSGGRRRDRGEKQEGR